MQRIACSEREDWQAPAESAGFTFHTIDGERYWDERAYYAFTLDQTERQIEVPSGEIDAMCLELDNLHRLGRAWHLHTDRDERRQIGYVFDSAGSVLTKSITK